MEAVTTVVNFRDFFRGEKPISPVDTVEGTTGSYAVGEDLVPDFTDATDYIEDIEEKDAEAAYAPSGAFESYNAIEQFHCRSQIPLSAPPSRQRSNKSSLTAKRLPRNGSNTSCNTGTLSRV